jgi:hypothetical protein
VFDHIVNWKLLSGPHEFPGPDGGTCINEAAIVAAGFEYKTVNNYKDLPRCFSPVIGAALIEANDMASDPDRQHLMWFVARLSGSRGDYRTEVNRAWSVIIRAAMGCLETSLGETSTDATIAACQMDPWYCSAIVARLDSFGLKGKSFSDSIRLLQNAREMKDVVAPVIQALRRVRDWAGDPAERKIFIRVATAIAEALGDVPDLKDTAAARLGAATEAGAARKLVMEPV